MNNWVKLPVSPVMGVAKPVIRVIGDGPGTNAIKWGGAFGAKANVEPAPSGASFRISASK